MSSAGVLQAVVRFLGSFALAIIVLFLLLVLTYFGTLAQADRSLFDVQRDYFESIYLIEKVGPIPLVLPGAYLSREVGGANPGKGYIRAAMVGDEDEMTRGLEAMRACLLR